VIVRHSLANVLAASAAIAELPVTKGNGELVKKMSVTRTETFEIRPANRGDVPALVDVAQRAWLNAFEGNAPQQMIAWWKRANREPSWYERDWPSMLVAELSKDRVIERSITIVGVVQTIGSEVNGLWVHPDFHRQGIGSALLAAGESHIAAAGHQNAWLTCSGFNRRAREFYESRGYRLTAST
jgi:ribosomal protein S18 acetylase RimI-like enzyme